MESGVKPVKAQHNKHFKLKKWLKWGFFWKQNKENRKRKYIQYLFSFASTLIISNIFFKEIESFDPMNQDC